MVIEGRGNASKNLSNHTFGYFSISKASPFRIGLITGISMEI